MNKKEKKLIINLIDIIKQIAKEQGTRVISGATWASKIMEELDQIKENL